MNIATRTLQRAVIAALLITPARCHCDLSGAPGAHHCAGLGRRLASMRLRG